MGGKRCLEEILKINAVAKVIVATGYPIPKKLKEEITATAKGFINKPYEANILLQKTRKILDS